MRKLILDVDALAVESFETAAADDAAGTVQGRALAPEPITDKTPLLSCGTCYTMCSCNSCRSCISCFVTCFDATCISCNTCATCGESCGPTLCQATFPDNCCAIA